MSDPFEMHSELPGGLLRKDDPRGSLPATLAIGPDGIRARLADGSEEHLAWHGLRLVEGPGGDGLYCVAPDRALTVHSAHPEFLRALEAASGNALDDAIAALHGERTSSRWRHRTGCALALALALLCAWSVPRLFRGAISAGVSALPFEVDRTIGRSVFEQMSLGGPEVDDELVRGAVQAMLDRLAPQSAIPEVTFTFKVVESEQVNAFALPGGYVVVFTGLLKEADRPEEVCGVLAHEMAHVTRRHGLRRMAHAVGLWAAVGLVFGNTDGLSALALQVFTLANVNDYSQDQETEADLEGARMLIEARVDPGGLADFFRRLEAEQGDVPDGMAWLSTHPQHERRIEAVQAFQREHGQGVEYEPLAIDWDAVRARL